MIRLVHSTAPHAETSVEAVIARHGALPVLLAALGALLRLRQKPPPLPARADDLPAHLKRDIGLPPETAHARFDALPPLRIGL